MTTSLAGVFGAIESGGTKFVCALGTGPGDLEAVRIPTTSPDATMASALAFFKEQHRPPRAIGIASFGPVDLHCDSPSFGHITSTPKLPWRDFDIAGAVRDGLGVPVGFDTDVNGSVLGEARWGAGQGLTDFLYLTIGTGVGGGAMVNGSLLHGLVHPEMGHIRIPHDLARDPYPGGCPYHGDCLEGLASGPAIEARWGKPGAELPAGHPAWALEAHYLALAVNNWVCTLSPRRIVMGGGVMRHPPLFGLIREEVAAILNRYIQAPDMLEGLDAFIVPPKLGSQSGVLGGLVLAEQAYTSARRSC